MLLGECSMNNLVLTNDHEAAVTQICGVQLSGQPIKHEYDSGAASCITL